MESRNDMQVIGNVQGFRSDFSPEASVLQIKVSRATTAPDLDIRREKMVFDMRGSTGNIWMAENCGKFTEETGRTHNNPHLCQTAL